MLRAVVEEDHIVGIVACILLNSMFILARHHFQNVSVANIIGLA
jgi:hypothetical protein